MLGVSYDEQRARRLAQNKLCDAAHLHMADVAVGMRPHDNEVDTVLARVVEDADHRRPDAAGDGERDP